MIRNVIFFFEACDSKVWDLQLAGAGTAITGEAITIKDIGVTVIINTKD